MSSTPFGGDSESSGTTIYPENSTPILSDVPTEPQSASKGEEDALESHEVIELQTFIERKAWIEEKIKFLDKMPPIEVFVGLDAIRSSAEEVPGLPTRAELQQWVVEHDAIEKDTEVLDAGELKKLRTLTKAATQRNLSPHDTDLIELTLTTIYELDKLLHLLRDRSENLELLGIRLRWEENRIASWRDRRQILSDLKAFLTDRAQWSSSVYDIVEREPQPDSHRRGSIASVRSITSIGSDTSLSSLGLSRSNRFKLAELLSRDAAQFSGRVTSLRHGTIAAAGKALDKLIDSSRKPVPDELLDEQDKLEEKGISEMENIGKFIMNVIMQWRKADELYAETLKDQTAARTLIDEIESGKLNHPTSKQSTNFASRSDTIVKRLNLRGIPSAPGSSFPCPLHPLFPEQEAFNKSLSETLSSEILTARDLCKKVEAMAKEYCATYEAVKNADALIRRAEELVEVFGSITQRLTEGVASGDGDGTPPDLTTSDCLSPTRHSVFLALLPTILDEQHKADKNASKLLRTLPAALLRLDFPGIDPTFKEKAGSVVQRLTEARDVAQRRREDITSRAARLKEARKIWTAMDQKLKALEEVQRDVGEAMDRYRWKQESGRMDAPPTPESPPIVSLPPPPSPTGFHAQLQDLSAKLTDEVETPLASLSSTLEAPLKDWFTLSALGLKDQLQRVTQMLQLLELIRSQSSVMTDVRNEFNDLQIRVEDVKLHLDSSLTDTMAGGMDSEQVGALQNQVSGDVVSLRLEIGEFVEKLPRRVPFVSQPSSSTPSSPKFVRKRFSSVDLKLGAHSPHQSIEIPFDLQALNDAVRLDSNTFAMRLNGDLSSLEQKLNHLELGRIAKEVDATLSVTNDALQHALSATASFKASFSDVKKQGNSSELLNILSQDISRTTQSHRAVIARSFSPVRDRLRRMASAPGVTDSAVHESIYLARTRALDDAELKFTTWTEDTDAFAAHVSEVLQQETRRLEDLRAAEEAERERLERERVEEERRGHLEEEKRKRLEEEEQQRVEEERRHLEEERIAEERRLQEERERIAAEEVERVRLESERIQEERRLLAEQRRLQEENEEAERERVKLEREQEEKRRLEEDRLAEERRVQEELEKVSAEEERVRLQYERKQQEAKRQEDERIAEARRVQEGQRIADEEAEQAEEQERLELERQCVEESAAAAERIRLEATAREREMDFLSKNDAFVLQPAFTLAFRSPELNDLHARILRLRKRLQSLSLSELISPVASNIPDEAQARQIAQELYFISAEVSELPTSIDDPSINMESKSLKADLERSQELLQQIQVLSVFGEAVRICDAGLSDLLEHIDSYPALPVGPMASSFDVPADLVPTSQLMSRLSFTKNLVEVVSGFSQHNDLRISRERDRIVQTWVELEEMANDRVSGRKSRPSSALNSDHSSGRNSSASMAAVPPPRVRKIGGYAGLSATPSSRGMLNVPAIPLARRAVSGSEHAPQRSTSSSRMSMRSTSGPSGLNGTTFASRQRTNSLTPHLSPLPTTPLRRTNVLPKKRSTSPSISNASSYGARSSSSMSLSTWSRTPRTSFPTFPRMSTPPKKPPPPRKKYVANPKSKLDVAVGDVVNNLPVGINIESVSGSWEDQSGKYWIGNQDPKLCFCRILRSQTVMVRVGGGWSELSKFIQTHCADAESFRLLDDNTPLVSREEKWISSSTLLEAVEGSETPPVSPRTPEPKESRHLPSFSISSPSGRSSHSITSSPSSKGGSPLTALQFLRRAESPSPSKPIRVRHPTGTTPARNSIWRP